MPRYKSKKTGAARLSFNSFIILGALVVLAATIIFFRLNVFASSSARVGKGGGTVTPAPLPTPVAGELLTNASFEFNTDADSQTPDGWLQHYDQPNRLAKVVCDSGHSGNCSYYVDG